MELVWNFFGNLLGMLFGTCLELFGSCLENVCFNFWGTFRRFEKYPLQQASYISKMQGLNPPEAFEIFIDSSGFVTPFLLTFAEKEGTGVWEMESKGILGQMEMREY